MNFKKNTEDKIGIIFFLIGLIYLLIMTYIGLTNLGVWYDEIYSMGISNLPLNEMFSLGTKDVHPLLYYLIFKVFIKLFGILNIVNLTLIGKVVSLIPFYLITLLSFTKVKKNFGIL